MSTNKRSLVIILHEIYGINNHINYFCDLMMNEGFDVFSPNLLHRESFPYDQEDKAYSYFMMEIGFNKSIDDVKQIVRVNKDKYDRVYIIGFSIGATLAWMSSELEIDGIIGFYGSRIRDYVEIEPRCPTLLFFSSNEKSVNVLDLERKLKEKKEATVEIVESEHGFMNPFYKTHDLQKYRECLEKSIDFLRRIEGDKHGH
ncbi:dienelactone hydrolase family protein [Paenibacillus sp. GCM10027628]|uniref:dienelactone hydrolase family protein n=1 Tax=Paenibacillus sp. GCM10027628 TaxID=3273413 RepID=UPI00363D33F0